MTLEVHHLEKSQSERIVWLCEELSIPYTLIHHARNPTTLLAQDDLKRLHPAGTAPYLVDPSTTLAESAAIVEYLIRTHGANRLWPSPGSPHYAAFLSSFHAANGTLQPSLGRLLLLDRAGAGESPPAAALRGKLAAVLGQLDAQLGETGAYLAGEFSAADVMTVFTLTTMRGFTRLDLGPYGNILRYLGDVGKREGYRRAMEKGDPGMVPMLGAQVELFDYPALRG